MSEDDDFKRTMRPKPGESACSSCGDFLLFSSRLRGDGFCGPCSRKANGTDTLVDALHAWQEAGCPPPVEEWQPSFTRLVGLAVLGSVLGIPLGSVLGRLLAWAFS